VLWTVTSRLRPANERGLFWLVELACQLAPTAGRSQPSSTARCANVWPELRWLSLLLSNIKWADLTGQHRRGVSHHAGQMKFCQVSMNKLSLLTQKERATIFYELKSLFSVHF
jgi:hypothetical protein